MIGGTPGARGVVRLVRQTPEDLHREPTPIDAAKKIIVKVIELADTNSGVKHVRSEVPGLTNTALKELREFILIVAPFGMEIGVKILGEDMHLFTN